MTGRPAGPSRGDARVGPQSLLLPSGELHASRAAASVCSRVASGRANSGLFSTSGETEMRSEAPHSPRRRLGKRNLTDIDAHSAEHGHAANTRERDIAKLHRYRLGLEVGCGGAPVPLGPGDGLLDVLPRGAHDARRLSFCTCSYASLRMSAATFFPAK